MDSCACVNNYTDDTFLERFSEDDADLRRCAQCNHFIDSDGMYMCSKFSSGSTNSNREQK